MLRPLILKADTDLKSLAASVTDRRLKPDRADAAMARLAAANPHVDPASIAAGTVVLVPDGPEFKASAAGSVQSQPFADFSAMATAAMEAANGALRQGLDARAAERKEVAAALASAQVRRSLAGDADVQKMADEAMKIAAQEEVDDKQALEMIGASLQAAQVALAGLGKVVG